MKRILLLFIFISQYYILGNPIDITPRVQFSELIFVTDSEWIVEIYIPRIGDILLNEHIDSIMIKTSSGTALLNAQIPDTSSIFIITQDDLSIPLEINRDGDIVEIFTYSSLDSSHKAERQDYIKFGDYPEASVGKPFGYYSLMRNWIERYFDYWIIDCLTANPSPGVRNNITGLGAIMQGRIYDINNNLVKQLVAPYSFELDFLLLLDGEGYYSTKVFPLNMSSTVKHLKVVIENSNPRFFKNIDIDSISFHNIFPDTIINQDIHLKSNEFVISGIENNPKVQPENIEVINYPNPFNSSTNFYVKIPAKLKNQETLITIYNSNGEQVRSLLVNQNTKLSWDGKNTDGNIMPSGIYYYSLSAGTNKLKSGSMILLK